MPHAVTCRTSSPGPGDGSAISATSSWCDSLRMAARMSGLYDGSGAVEAEGASEHDEPLGAVALRDRGAGDHRRPVERARERMELDRHAGREELERVVDALVTQGVELHRGHVRGRK